MTLEIHPITKKEAEKNGWRVKASKTSFMGGRSQFNALLGKYRCGNCGDNHTSMNYSRGTDAEYSELIWIEIYCYDCEAFTMYDLY